MTLPIPQPNTLTYPAADLNLFATSSRGPAGPGGDPPYDPTRRPKYWKDPAQASAADPTAFCSYLVFHQSPVDGSWTRTNIYMTADEASKTNFPDAMPAAPPKLPAWETPVRPLEDNEKMLPTTFALLIQRTDIANQPVAWTQADENLLHAIGAKVLGS